MCLKANLVRLLLRLTVQIAAPLPNPIVCSQIRMLADPQGKLAKALGVDADVPPLGLVSKRYSSVINDNVIKSFNLEGDGFGLTCSLANATISQLKDA